MNFAEEEKKILAFWEEKKIFKKLQEKTKGKTSWSFFDGPITANNPMGVHHAWGRTLKDFFQRYKAMRGFDQRWQNGFDCQGLWVEVEVEKDLGFNSKKDIEAFGLGEFSKACSDRVKKFAGLVTEQSKRLGQWMEWENSYFTMSEENNLHIWNFLKTCHENGWIRKGTDVVPWCHRCGTGISQHELSDEGYAEVKHQSVYVAFPLRTSTPLPTSPLPPEGGRSNAGSPPSSEGGDKEGDVKKDDSTEFLLVWTTTPWTLLANVAAAVDPKLEYARVSSASILPLGKGEDKGGGVQTNVWLAKNRVSVVFGEDAEILETKKGKELIGLEYAGPFDDLPASNVPHRVVAWSEVSAEEGTGIVHIATGCGKEDHALGLKEQLPVIDPIEEDGSYRAGFGEFTDTKAQEAGSRVIEALKEKHLLVKTESITHSYPICWRCKEELLFRVSTEWFIAADEIRPLMKKAAATVAWIPEYAGKRMQDWLDNMGDWPISRKRYWGLALPFYECSCGELTVIGSKKELRERSTDSKIVDELPELHRPWIDAVKIKCPKCGEEVTRIPDVGDCWLDAGIIPFSTLKYPTPDFPDVSLLRNGILRQAQDDKGAARDDEEHGDRSYWERWFPAEFVCESIPQIKLWFYTLLFMSVALENRAPYKTVLTYASVVDEKGKAMHKSTGNAIWFDDAVEKMGADVMRWVYLRGGVEDNLRFGFAIGEEMRKKLLVLWNVVSFYTLFSAPLPTSPLPAEGGRIDANSPPSEMEDGSTNSPPSSEGGDTEGDKENILDIWIRARLKKTAFHVTELLDQYRTPEAVKLLETFVDDLSTWYVRRSRDRFKSGEQAPRIVLRNVLETLARLIAPFAPFLAERIFLSLCHSGDSVAVDRIHDHCESVHLQSWPIAENTGTKTEKKVLTDMEHARKICELVHALRAEARLKVRQPLAVLVYEGVELEKEYEQLIAEELNVNSVQSTATELKKPAVREEGGITVRLELAVNPELARAGIARELTRAINQFRKELGLQAGSIMSLAIVPDDKMVQLALVEHGEDIYKATDTESKNIPSGEGSEKEIAVGMGSVVLRMKRP